MKNTNGAPRVAHVVRQFSPSIGGLESSVQALCTALESQSLARCKVLTLDHDFRKPDVRLPPREDVAGIPVVRLPFSGSQRYPLWPALLKHIDDVDIVHVHAIDFAFDFMALTRFLHRRALVASTHGGFFHTEFAARLKRTYFKSVTRASCAMYDQLMATSQNDFETFRTITSKVSIVENGVDIGKFRDLASRHPNKTIIYFGRLSPNKNLHALFPLLKELNARDPGWRIIIAGVQSGVTIAELAAAAQGSEVAGSVEFIDAPTNAGLRELIGRATYFVSLSSYEGFGLTAIEAMSAGLTPVLSNIPTFSSFVQRAGVGLAMTPDDPVALAQAILNLAESQGPAARERAMAASDRYSWTRAATETRRVYDLVRQ